MEVLYLKIFRLSLVLLLLFIVTSSIVSANTDVSKEKPNFIKKADSIIVSNRSADQRLKELTKQGWVVADDFTTGVSPFSPVGCGSITNQSVLKQWDSSTSRYLYLIQANWDFTTASCFWDADSGKAADYVALSVVNQSNNAVNAQAEYAQIYVYDEDGDYYPTRGAISNYNAAGLTGTIQDAWTIPDNIGENGQVWFYIQKPTNGTSYYVRSQWTHTWSDNTATLSSVTIGYPYAISATWANNYTPQQWSVADQDFSTFP